MAASVPRSGTISMGHWADGNSGYRIEPTGWSLEIADLNNGARVILFRSRIIETIMSFVMA